MKSVPLKLLTTVKCFGTVPKEPEPSVTDSPHGYPSPHLLTLGWDPADVKRCDIRLYEIPDVIPGHEGFTESICFLKSLAEAIGGTPVLAAHRDSHPNLKVSVPSYLCLVMPKDGRKMDYEELRNTTTLDVDEVMCFSNLDASYPPQNPHLHRVELLTALDTDGLGWLAWDLHDDMMRRMEPYFLRPLNTLNRESQIQTIQLPLFSSLEEFKMKLALAGGKLQTNQMEYAFSSDLNYFRGMWEHGQRPV